jgi:hypothetical protein
MTDLVQTRGDAVEEVPSRSHALVVRDAIPAEPPDLLDDVLFLRAALARSTLDACAAEREVERLTLRVRELETWIDKRALFDEVEHLQIGRLLAAAECRRIERLSRPLVSLRTVLLVVYGAVLASLAVLILVGGVYG